MMYSARMTNVRRGPFDQVSAELSNFFKVGDSLAIHYTDTYFALFGNGQQYSQQISIEQGDEGGYYLINTIRGTYFLERNNKDYWIMPARTYKDENGETQYCPDTEERLHLKKVMKPFINKANCMCMTPYGKRCNKKMGVRPLNVGL